MFRKKLPLFVNSFTASFAAAIQEFSDTYRPRWWETAAFTKVLAIYAFILGILFTFWIPPFTKPDETSHFFRTISITQGEFICSTKDGVLLLDIPDYLTKYPVTVAKNIDSTNRPLIRPTTTAKTVLQQQRVACTLPFLSYISTGIVLAPFVWLHASPEFIFYFGRLLNFFTAFALLFYAFSLTPKKLRLIPASVFLLPMTWHQASSFNKEHLHIGFGLLAICLLLSFLSKKSVITYKQIGLFILSLFMTIIARPQYAPLILLAYMIPREKIHRDFSFFERFTFWKSKKSIAVPSVGRLLVIAAVIAAIGLSLRLNFYSVSAEKLGEKPQYELADADKQLEYLISHPDAWVTLPYYTFLHRGDFLFDSMVGSLGSYDIFFDWYVYTILIIFFGLTVYWSRLFVPEMKYWQLGILTFTILSCSIGILLAMYLYATTVANYLITGLQGRYFIVLLPLVLWWVAELRARLNRWFDILLLLLVLLSIIKMTVMYY